jgi:hypothetical protein
MAIQGGDGSTKENAITIETFADFLQVNTSSNAMKYVRILNDINVSAEPWYEGSIDGWSSDGQNKIYCRFFADSDSPKTISGLTVVNPVLFIGSYSGSSNQYVFFENINIIDCCYKISVTSGSAYVFSSSAATANIRFIRCNISLFVVDNGFETYLFAGSTNNLQIVDSTIYVKHKLNNTKFYISLGTNSQITRSTIILDGFFISHYARAGGTDVSVYCLQRTTGKKVSSCLIFRNCRFDTFMDASRTKSWLLCQSSEGNSLELQSYYAFDNCTFDDGLPLPVFGTITSRLVACNSQTQAFTHETYSGNNDATIFATMVDSTDPNFNTSSIKSQQYLIDSGFLP